MLFVVKERLEGLKYNIGLGGGVRYVQKKGPFYGSVSTLFSLIVVFRQAT